MMAYKLTNNGFVIRSEDSAYIPMNDANPDYQAYLAWVAAGNTADPADSPPVIIPQSCTVTQGGLALIAAGLMPAVQAVIDGLRADPVANAAALWAWDKAPTWDRNSPSLKAIAAAAGITDAQMDDLFIAAPQMVG